jgi:hypothetical protein
MAVGIVLALLFGSAEVGEKRQVEVAESSAMVLGAKAQNIDAS